MSAWALSVVSVTELCTVLPWKSRRHGRGAQRFQRLYVRAAIVNDLETSSATAASLRETEKKRNARGVWSRLYRYSLFSLVSLSVVKERVEQGNPQGRYCSSRKD